MTTMNAQTRLPWSREEDQALIAAVAVHGEKRWTNVASQVPGRTGKGCSHRWRTYLRPNVKHPHLEPFSEWEAAYIVAAQKEVGNKWLEIAHGLGTLRSNTAVKNFWHCQLKGKRNHNNRFIKHGLSLHALLEVPSNMRTSSTYGSSRELHSVSPATPTTAPGFSSPPGSSNGTTSTAALLATPSTGIVSGPAAGGAAAGATGSGAGAARPYAAATSVSASPPALPTAQQRAREHVLKCLGRSAPIAIAHDLGLGGPEGGVDGPVDSPLCMAGQLYTSALPIGEVAAMPGGGVVGDPWVSQGVPLMPPAIPGTMAPGPPAGQAYMAAAQPSAGYGHASAPMRPAASMPAGMLAGIEVSGFVGYPAPASGLMTSHSLPAPGIGNVQALPTNLAIAGAGEGMFGIPMEGLLETHMNGVSKTHMDGANTHNGFFDEEFDERDVIDELLQHDDYAV